MKTNKKYNYEIPNMIIRPFLFLYFTQIIAWRDSGKEPLELSDIPTWVIRQLGVIALRRENIEYNKTKVLSSSFNMLFSAKEEWVKRKIEILNRKNIIYRVIKD